MRYAIVLCAVLMIFSCQAKKPATVSHVVVCWLKTPGNEAQRQQLIDESLMFQKIPGVVSVSAGRAIPSDRPVVESTFDVAVVIAFEDERALQAYENHPIHIQAVNNVLRPLTSKVQIYDIIHATHGAKGGAGAEAAPARQGQSPSQEQLFTPR